MQYSSFPFKLVGTLTMVGTIFLVNFNGQRVIDLITSPTQGWVRIPQRPMRARVGLATRALQLSDGLACCAACFRAVWTQLHNAELARSAKAKH
jgi:hypothetical protein